jgi:hypothetical protein
MGNFFKKANQEEVVRFETPDGEDFIEFRASLSKGEANKLSLNAPRKEGDIEQGITFQEKFFAYNAVRWSFVDEDGEMVPISVEAYNSLDAGAARWIDEQLRTQMQKIFGLNVEKLEGE